MRTTGEPVLVGLESDSKPVVIDPEIAIAAARHRARQYDLDLLRYHADIGLVTADITEAVIAEAIVEMAEQHDVVFQCKIRPSPSATTSESAASTTPESARSSTGEARSAARGSRAGRPARGNIEAASPCASRPVG